MPTKPKVDAAADKSKDEDQPSIFEALRRVMLVTIGAAAIAQEKVEALVDRLVDRGKSVEKDCEKLAGEMREKRTGRKTKVEQELSKHVESVLDRMNIPSKTDVDSLGLKIEELTKKIDEMKNS